MDDRPGIYRRSGYYDLMSIHRPTEDDLHSGLPGCVCTRYIRVLLVRIKNDTIYIYEFLISRTGRLSSLAFETFLFALTLIKFFQSISRCRSSILFVFMRDGTWAFTLIFGKLSTSSPDITYAYWPQSLCCSICSCINSTRHL